jgi:1-acyl-sn-glycerol-3-phosphate acyltransferase
VTARHAGRSLRRGPRSRLRYRITRSASAVVARCLFRLRTEGLDRLPEGPAIICFNHLSWADPFVIMAALPWFPRLSFFGPKEEDMARGGRNRLMAWTGTAVPYKPGKNDLLEATRRVGAILGTGEWLAIAAEGRIHVGEATILPLTEGVAFFALRTGAPIVPVAINGTSWLGLGRRVRVRAGEPIAPPAGRPGRVAIDALTLQTRAALVDLVADAQESPPPGRFGRWLTERFNEWPDGARPEPPASSERAGPVGSPPADA